MVIYAKDASFLIRFSKLPCVVIAEKHSLKKDIITVISLIKKPTTLTLTEPLPHPPGKNPIPLKKQRKIKKNNVISLIIWQMKLIQTERWVHALENYL